MKTLKQQLQEKCKYADGKLTPTEAKEAVKEWLTQKLKPSTEYYDTLGYTPNINKEYNNIINELLEELNQ